MKTISNLTARRFLLGRQGLWPGRRWRGREGAASAIRSLEALQMDSVTIVARSHDIVLWSRVLDYEPAQLQQLLYSDRQFFDYGGHLDIYPMEELQYWRLHMKRRRDAPRHTEFAAAHEVLLEEVRSLVRDRGPVANRELTGNERVSSYRGRKDTAVALYHLWLTGELMTSSRRGFERLYDLCERVAPSKLLEERPEAEAEAYFERKALRQAGLGTTTAWGNTVSYSLARRSGRLEQRRRLLALVENGEAEAVRIEGSRDIYYLPAADAPLLRAVEAGEVPEQWLPLDTNTEQEAVLLSPLDPLLDRRRTLALFGFEHIWEIYKPARQRRWGAYTLPVLYGDRLVARLEPSIDRKTGTLTVHALWLEDPELERDVAFMAALASGLRRFARFHSASRITLPADALTALTTVL